MKNPIPLLLTGTISLFLLKGKKRRPSSKSIKFDADIIIGGLEPEPNEVVFDSDLNQYKIGSGYRVNVLDQWLNERRLSGKLATLDHDAGWLYSTFIDDPTTWIGDITGTGKVGGQVIYSALWLMATSGIGIYASGFASTAADIYAVSNIASDTAAMKVLGKKAVNFLSEYLARGGSPSKIVGALVNFGGTESLAKYGVSKAIAASGAGAVAGGLTMASAALLELGINESYSEDLASSATEAAAEFTLNHDVNISGIPVSIALLPSSYKSVQEFNKFLMAYIIRFQKMTF